MKPKRPCSFPGCPNLTDGRFCPEHEKQENKRYEQKTKRDAAKVSAEASEDEEVSA